MSRRGLIAKEDKSKKVIHKNKKNKIIAKDSAKIAENKRKILKVSFVIVLCILAVIAYYILNNGHKLGLSINKKLTIKNASKITVSNSDSIVKSYSDKILIYEYGKIKTYSSKGKLLYENKVDNIFAPSINTSGTFIQLVNNVSGDVFVFDDKYQVGTISLGKEIISSKITADGLSIIHYKALGSKSALSIFDKKGKELYKINLESNLLNNYLLAGGNKYLIYVEPNTKGISVVSNVNLIDLNSLDKSIQQIISKENEIVYDINYKSGNINIITDSTVISYNILNKKVKEESIIKDTPIDVEIDSNTYIYTTSNKEDLNYTNCNIKKIGSDKIDSFSFKGKHKYFKVQDEIIAIGFQEEIYLYNIFGKQIKEISAQGVVTQPYIFNNGKNIYMVISNNVLVYSI